MSNRFFFLICLLSLFLFSCVNEDNVSDNPSLINKDGFSCFALKTPSGAVYDSFLIQDSTIHIKVPNQENLHEITPIFELNNGSVYCDSVEIKSGISKCDLSDFVKPLELLVKYSKGSDKKYKVIVYDLPVLIINTPNGVEIDSKEIRTEGCQLQLITDDGVEDLGLAGIKGRGNSSWMQPKKPYNIKLDEKHSLLGMKSSKHWILLANAHFDRTQLHNAAAFEMARLTDYPWVQSGDFLELIMNGEHKGLYYLCEKIRIEKGKIDIKEIKNTDLEGESLTGGYLLETVQIPSSDNYIVSDYFNRTDDDNSSILYWVLKTPDPDEEEVPQVQIDYIKNTLNKMESTIFIEDSLKNHVYLNYIDIETAINWLLIEEATLNSESRATKNMYMYKERGGKFVIGPPWDFDAWTFGVRATDTFFAKYTAYFFNRLFDDELFVRKYKEKWNLYKNIWASEIPIFINKKYEEIHRSAERNDMMWPDWYHGIGERFKSYTYYEVVENMKNSLLNQIKWMDDQIVNF